MKINMLLLISTFALILGQTGISFAQVAKKSTFSGSLIDSDGSVFYDPLVQEGLLSFNPDNSDESMAFVVCKNEPVSEMQGSYWKNANCKIQKSPTAQKPCKYTKSGKVLDKNKKSINLKPQYTATIEKYAVTKIDLRPSGPVNDIAIAYVNCTMEKNGERVPNCKLQTQPPAYINCSEEDADTDNKPRAAAPQRKGSRGHK